MRRAFLLVAAAVLLAACVDEPGAGFRPSAQHQPSGGPKLSIQTIANKSQQFGLEDALASAVRDELLRDGRYSLVPVNESDDVVAITITHYLLVPIGYDVTLAPVSYKLRINADLAMLDRVTSKPLWTEKNLEGSLTYPNPLLSGGMSEAQAQATIWTVLAPMIVERIVDGFKGAALSTATAAAPATAPGEPAVYEPR
jgi:hypothetical protein